MACKEWNGVPEDGLNLLGSSYDNTGALGASTWRHVAFIEQPGAPRGHDGGPAAPTRPMPQRAGLRRHVHPASTSACRRFDLPGQRARPANAPTSAG